MRLYCLDPLHYAPPPILPPSGVARECHLGMKARCSPRARVCGPRVSGFGVLATPLELKRYWWPCPRPSQAQISPSGPESRKRISEAEYFESRLRV